MVNESQELKLKEPLTITIVGRTKEDLEKYGIKASGYIGKHIVGEGEDAHLTTQVFIDLLKPHVILCCGKRGSGKCVTGDTLVYLKDGRPLPIEEIVKNKESATIFSIDENEFSIKNSKIVNFFVREEDKILKIKLWNGVEIKVTEEHPLLTPFGWKLAKDIKEGDVIGVVSRLPAEGNGYLGEEKLKILAYILSEGTVRNTFVWFSNSNQKIVEDFSNAVKEFDSTLKVLRYGETTYRVVGTKPKIEEMNIRRSSKGSFTRGTRTIVRRNSLLRWLDLLELKNKRAEEKFIPPLIFTLSNERVALFLKYIFSGDGSLYEKKCKNRKVYILEYCSKSKRLVEQIHCLLLRFGIFSYIREKKVKNTTYYRLFITDRESVKKFITNIGVVGKEKLVKKILNETKKYHSNFDFLPKAIWDYIRKNYRKKDIGIALGYKNYKGISSKYKYNPLKLTIQRIGAFFNDKYLLKISSPDIIWVRVVEKKVVSGMTKVYDITVNDSHNFIGNGVILHNSYSAGVIIEEILSLEKEYSEKIACVVFDPVGIYWSMKIPNEQQRELLKAWNIEPKRFDQVKVYVPLELKSLYEEAGIPVDYAISISPKEFSPDDWALAFNLERTSQEAIALERNFNELLLEKEDFGLDDLITKIRSDKLIKQEIKNILINFLEVAKSWGIFSVKGMEIEDIVRANQASIIDLSRVKGEAWGLRNLIAAWVTRQVYRERVLARKEEELARVEGREPKKRFPLTWLFFEEAHNFVPSYAKTVSTEPILTIAKQGREPGVSLVVITQMPGKIHQDVLSQCDLVISFRLTSKDDLQALHSVYQTYMPEELEKLINKLPRHLIGSAIILDDSLEKVFSVNIRPRMSHSAGGTAIIV